MISFSYYSQLQFYYATLLDSPEEDHQVLGFINSVVDPDDEDDDIFEPERSFSGVLNTFVNRWRVRKDKNIFKLGIRFHDLPEIPEMLETYANIEPPGN